MNGLMRSPERIGRGLVAAAALVGLVVVVPLLLVRFVGWPLPTNLPAPGSVLEEVERRGISDGTFVKALALVVWIAWARFSLSIGIEVSAAVRHRPSPAHRSLGGSQRLAAALVTAVMALTGTLAGVTGAGATRTPIARSVAAMSLRSPPTARTSVVAAAETAVPGGGNTAHRWVVVRNDSLWGIAEEVLGDGSRWREIVDANVGREISPGVVFDRDTEAIQPGWELLVPRRNAAQPTATNGEVVLVERGDTLASIAADRYGDAAAWSTLWEANAGRDFGGRSFDDPDLIMPGWDLLVPEDPDRVVLEPVDPMPLLSATHDDHGDHGDHGCAGRSLGGAGGSTARALMPDDRAVGGGRSASRCRRTRTHAGVEQSDRRGRSSDGDRGRFGAPDRRARSRRGDAAGHRCDRVGDLAAPASTALRHP